MSTTKKTIGLVAVCMALGGTIVLVLILCSGILKDKRQSFLRLFPPHPALEGDSLSLPYNSYYIAGSTSHTLYLGNSTAAHHLLQVNLMSLDTQHVRLNIPGMMTQKFWAPRVQVDSPYYYLSDGAVPFLYRGTVHDWSGISFLPEPFYFRSIIAGTNSSVFLKSLGTTPPENMLGKLTSYQRYPIFKKNILEKQLDGVFCTDGMLHYDRATTRLVYLYYYRNEFIVMDSSLNVVYKGHTIDTTTRAKIATGKIANTKTLTLAAPPLIVNRASSMNARWLFVHSGLRARNESARVRNTHSMLDVYRLSDGDYQFSFPIYPYGSKQMIQFKALDDKIIVLYDRLIRVYTLRAEYFDITDEPI